MASQASKVYVINGGLVRPINLPRPVVVVILTKGDYKR